MPDTGIISIAPSAGTADRNDGIAPIARRLLAELGGPGAGHGHKGLLLERALAYAARAEQRIAQQSERIHVLETLSITDELTGLLNRRGFLQQLDREVAAAGRYGIPGALLYCDLDGFKTVNDEFGHAAGDLTLRHVAKLLASSVRRIDIAGRLGGDEFGIILVQADARSAAKRAQTLQWFVENTPVLISGQPVTARISMGIEPFTGEEQVEDLVARADMAMYDRKRRKAGQFWRGAAE